MISLHERLTTLSPTQRQALYDQARREALALRRQAIADAVDGAGRGLQALASATGRRLRTAWQRVRIMGVAPLAPPRAAAACPR
jgi:hypothetical protein